jgi:hypothetical protein
LAGQLLFLKDGLYLRLWDEAFPLCRRTVGLGSALGSVPLYFLAYYGGKPLIQKSSEVPPLLVGRCREGVVTTSRARGTTNLSSSASLCADPALDPARHRFRNLPDGFFSFFVLTAVGSIIRMMLTLLVVGLSFHGLSQL